MTVQPSIDTSPSRRGVPKTALKLDAAVNLVDLARHDLNEVLRALPADVGLFQALDLVTALGHLKEAVRLTERVADVLEAEVLR